MPDEAATLRRLKAAHSTKEVRLPAYAVVARACSVVLGVHAVSVGSVVARRPSIEISI
jgi:hypothetical protein